jgi:hypothetical protein
MSTCELSVAGLKRVLELIDELSAWRRVLARHAGQQKRQISVKGIGEYTYNKRTKKVSWQPS